MKLTIFFFVFFVFLTTSIKANDLKIIELHQDKILDQIVLNDASNDSENDDKDDIVLNNENLEIESNNTLEESEEDLLNTDDVISVSEEAVTFLQPDTIFNVNEQIITNHFKSIKSIKSQSLHREFIKILSSIKLDEENNNAENITYSIISKLYEIGELEKAYNLTKKISLENITDQDKVNYFYFIELNYLYSTRKLPEACDLKSILINKGTILPEFLLEKTDIFCLILENKYSEASLLNSLLLESEKEIDENFQKLFKFMSLNNKDKQLFDSLSEVKSKELIFLYSAMLRINELPLDTDFIEVDPLNLSIPVVLSGSTPMNIRIKAANNAYFNNLLSIDSLSALYQSVDFNSKQFNNSEETIKSLNNDKEMIMAFYYQLINIQIFPDERLKVILDYWNFAKDSGLEEIAYNITNKIIETINPTSENNQFGLEIAFAYISNKNYIEAIKWINLFENSNVKNEKIEYAKFLIDLNETNQLDTIIKYISKNYENLNTINDQKTLESLEVLVNFLDISQISSDSSLYMNISDDRLMPSYFIIRDINSNMVDQNNISLFILSLISINNKKWIELHPEHLKLILEAFKLYENGLLIKPIILEILDEFEIF